MLKGRPKSLSELVGAVGSPLGQLAAQAGLRSDLSVHMRARLPDDLAGGLVHCNRRDDGTLVVTAASAAWASRLRFETPTLLKICEELGSHAERVKVRVAS